MWITSGAQYEPLKLGILLAIQAGGVLNTGAEPADHFSRSVELEYQMPSPVVKLKYVSPSRVRVPGSCALGTPVRLIACAWAQNIRHSAARICFIVVSVLFLWGGPGRTPE
ncbi:hypothetical protein D3C81_2005270 [compost metagenome]